MIAEIKNYVAVDIEHSFGSTYEGLVCLIQFTYEKDSVLKTAIIDCLAFYAGDLHKIFEDDKITKIMHSSLSNDIGWL